MSRTTEHLATPQSTREEFARRASRGFTPIRNIFVQRHTRGKWIPSSLGQLVRDRQPRALRAYLLLLLAWPWLEKRDAPLEAGVWARALSPSAPAPPWPAAAMTPVWSELEALDLIEKERHGRLVWIVPSREDGLRPYTRPRPDQGGGSRELYFVLPDAFWLEGWHETLTFPGLAVMLMLLYETTARDEKWIPYERVQAWYGISSKTLQNGLDDLRRSELLKEREQWVGEPLSAIGRTKRIHYSLRGPFSRAARLKLQAASTEAARARTAKKKPKKRRHKGKGA